MNDVAQAVDDARAIEIDTRGLIVLQRIVASAFTEGFLRKVQSMATQRFKERMTRRHPFQAVLFRGLSVRRQARIARGQGRQLPIGLAFVSFEYRRRPSGIEECGNDGNALSANVACSADSLKKRAIVSGTNRRS